VPFSLQNAAGVMGHYM